MKPEVPRHSNTVSLDAMLAAGAHEPHEQPVEQTATLGGEIVMRLLDVLLEGKLIPAAIGLKVLALACIIRHYRIEGSTPDVARDAGVTKAALTSAITKFRDRYGLRAAWMRSPHARQAMRCAAKQAHQRRAKRSRLAQARRKGRCEA
jgi:hypothetical protein